MYYALYRNNISNLQSCQHKLKYKIRTERIKQQNCRLLEYLITRLTEILTKYVGIFIVPHMNPSVSLRLTPPFRQGRPFSKRKSCRLGVKENLFRHSRNGIGEAARFRNVPWFAVS